MKSILLSFLAGALSVVAATGHAAGPYDLTFSTFFGGSAGEGIRDVESDRFGNVYVAGTTRSPDFPTTAGAYDETVDLTHSRRRFSSFCRRINGLKVVAPKAEADARRFRP